MAVQIYSMTSVADAVATVEAGADLVGLVVAEPGVVDEAIGVDLAREILAAIRPRSRGVALSLSDDRDEICAMVDTVRPDVLHIVAREIEPEDCAWIRKRITPVMLLRAIAVRAGETLTEADAHQDCVDRCANFVSIVGQQECDAARLRTDRSEDFTRQLGTDCFVNDTGLGDDEPNEICAGLGSRDGVGDRRHAVDLYRHRRCYPRPPRSSLPGVAPVHRPSSQVISPLTMIAR